MNADAAGVTILGGGSWGTALAVHLARSGRKVMLWVHDPDLADVMKKKRENPRYLPGFSLPGDISPSSDLQEALDGAVDILLVVPSHHVRETLGRAAPHIRRDASLLSASKGIETDTLMRVSEVIQDTLGERSVQLAVLSGPSFAREVSAGQPTAVVVASTHPDVAVRFQSILSSGTLRVYTNDDLVGVETGGAVKNVIAIGAGVLSGMGHGANSLAALITRGLAEIGRLAASLGGQRETLAGLAGLGDLVLTCTGRLSRNRALGEALGRGRTLEQHQATTAMVAEGVRTTVAVKRLAQREQVEMPITEQVHALLHEDKPVAEAVQDLLSRPPTSE